MKPPRYRYWSAEPELHLARRRELLKRHPELKSLFGFSRLTSIVMGAIIVAQLGLALFFERTHGQGGWVGSWALLLLTAYVVGGTLNHWAGMGIHEAAHNLVAKTELGNRWMAMLANVPILFPSAMSFRRYHLKHHSHLGIYPHDNDLAQDFEIRWVGTSAWRKAVWLFFYTLFAAGARGFWNKPSRWELINLAWSALCFAAIAWGIGWIGVAYLTASTFFGYGFHPVAAHFLHEHYIWKEGQETYSYYGLLNWVNFNVGYHNEHHDLMWIPGWKLPVIKRTAPEFYDHLESEKSWARLHWRFIFDSKIGHDSRIARDLSTLKTKRVFTETPGLTTRMITAEESAAEGEIAG